MATSPQDFKYPIDHLERCGLCLKTFREPRMLPCFDSFCKDCIAVYMDAKRTGQTFPCPLCTESIDIPEKGANGFDTNIHVAATRAVSAVFQRPDCDICETKDPAVNRCVECAQNMCQGCSKNHLKIKSTRSHHLANMTDPEGRVYLTSKAFCTKTPIRRNNIFLHSVPAIYMLEMSSDSARKSSNGRFSRQCYENEASFDKRSERGRTHSDSTP
ncbi:unnamed protein product [Mytilus edulis]|uniref:RING-type domain-containing protein n=1 Tax=Mytilus edulis TaxID=6550 RepID=A0A8S3V4X6_MYTED|nr:unnamed protein product [Mytilus edulis]